MRKLKISIAVGISLIFSFLAFAEDITVVVNGQASGTGLNAREKAIEDALRNAVEKGFGVYIDSSTLVENAALISDEIVAETKGFVRSYEVLDETTDGGVFTVKVRAVVSMDEIWESDSLNLLLKRMGAPRFVVVSSEEIDGESPKGNPAMQKMTEVLINRGFHLVSATNVNELSSSKRKEIVSDLERAVEVGRGANAEIIVLLKAKAAFEKKDELYGREMLFFNGITEAQVIKLDSKQVIASSIGKAIRGAHNPEEAIHDTLVFATANGSEDLIKNILSSWSEHLNMGRSIEVIVENVSASELSGLIESFKSLEGVSSVSQRKYSRKMAELEIRSKHNALYLSEAIENMAGFRLEVRSFTSNRIEIRKR